MATWKVLVERIESRQHEFTVEAVDAVNAQTFAFDKAGNHDFSQHSASVYYEIILVQKETPS